MLNSNRCCVQLRFNSDNMLVHSFLYFFGNVKQHKPNATIYVFLTWWFVQQALLRISVCKLYRCMKYVENIFSICVWYNFISYFYLPYAFYKICGENRLLEKWKVCKID